MYSIIKKVVMYVPGKLITINKSINKVIDLLEASDKTFTYVMKITGSTTDATRDTKK